MRTPCSAGYCAGLQSEGGGGADPRVTEADRVRGFGEGADDYVTT
jgi:hypothetical protein